MDVHASISSPLCIINDEDVGNMGLDLIKKVLVQCSH